MGTEIEVKKASAMTLQEQVTPMQMIQTAFQKAMESGGTEALAVADRILEQMAKQRDYEDREQFNAALRRIQDKIRPIVKDCENRQTHSRYASAEAVDKMIEKLIESEGMTLSFTSQPSDKDNEFIVVGSLSLGAYSREYPLPVPCDGKGPKGDGVMSRIHAVGSGITYAKRYIKNMIFNLRFTEKDDDGNGGSENLLDERTAENWIASIEGSASIDDLQKNYIGALKAAANVGDKAIIATFDKAKNATFIELRGKR